MLTGCKQLLLILTILGLGAAFGPAQEPDKEEDPPSFFDPEAEKEIEERIRRERIEDAADFTRILTFSAPLARAPYSFGQVVRIAQEAEVPVFDDRFQGLLGAAAMVGGGSSSSSAHLREASLLRIGEYLRCWLLQPFEPDVVKALRPDLLRAVRDRTGMILDVMDKEHGDEALAYIDAIIKAQRTSPDAFLKEADKVAGKSPITLAHLYSEPRDHRGKVVRFTGVLKRIRRFEPPTMAKMAGVENLYEAWIFDTAKHDDQHPICLIFSELPEGLPVKETYKKHEHKVTFVGYFYKLYLYRSANPDPKKKFRVAPMLVGHPVLKGSTEKEAGGGAGSVLAQTLLSAFPLIMIFIGILGVIVLVLFLRNRSSDSKSRAAVDRARRAAALRSSRELSEEPEDGDELRRFDLE